VVDDDDRRWTVTPSSIIWGQAPSGRPAWRVSGYRQIKTLMQDSRLAMEHPDPEAGQWFSDSPMHRVLVRLAAVPIPDRAADSEERARRRADMNKVFSPRNVHRATPDVESFARDLLDRLEEMPRPVDLTANYSIPLCARVVCDLMGVPAEDIPKFRRWAHEKDVPDIRRALLGLKELMTYVQDLVDQRREHPGDDIVSVLLANEAEDDPFHEGRITTLVAWLLGLGWQVAASAIDYGVLMLMTHPDQLARLRATPELLPRAVEEVLRMFKATSAAIGGLDRYAHADIEIDGVTIRRGDMVLLEVPAANRDAEVFPDPERFDIGRAPNPHLTFGHGFYFCNFNKVARGEVQIGLGALIERFPGLRLAVDPAELSYQEHPQSGVLSLPVDW
jgi:cytochrome P450